MAGRFKCGIVKAFAPNEDPNWHEFAARMGFVQEKLGLNAVFLKAFEDEGGWAVPFFCLEDTMGEVIDAKATIDCYTPYEVSGVRRLDVSKVDLETLRVLSTLLPEPAPAVKKRDVEPDSPLIIESAEDAFRGLVGMGPQKAKLMRIANAVVKQRKRKCEAADRFHFAFVGPPGTGKTELAMRLTAYLDHIHVTDGTGKFRKVGEADLVAKYVGHTAPKVKQAVEGALGGVLFIDEFYAIANAPHFGKEAIDALTDQIDAHREDFVCVVAGYPREVDETLDTNEGLRSRFGFRIEFPDYEVEELSSIFLAMADRRGFRVDDHAALSATLEKLRGTRGFANARTVSSLVDHSVIEALWERDDATIRASDLEAAAADLYEAGKTLGFA